MQQWKLVLQKESWCLCPKEAPVNVFKPNVTRHLSVLAEQAGNAFMAIQRRWYCVYILDSLVLAAVGIYLEVQISAGLPWWFYAAEYLNRAQIMTLVFNSWWVAELKQLV